MELKLEKERFDIVFGSGRKGQSYLSWINNKLAQLPITYFSPAAQWSNSPGIRHIKLSLTGRSLQDVSNAIAPTSKISSGNKQLEDFDHDKIIYAVDCERCHGPAAMHVDFQSKNPGVKEAKFIVNPGKLSRERLLDLCALCHGGPMTKTKPSFSFRLVILCLIIFHLKASGNGAWWHRCAWQSTGLTFVKQVLHHWKDHLYQLP